MKNILTLQNINLTLGGKQIIKNLSIEFWENYIHALIGPNGAGKSTVANMIMGLAGYRDFEGDILFEGESIKSLTITERAQLGITLAWQEPARFEGLTVEDFLYACAKERSRTEILDALKRVGLNPVDYLFREVGKTLSGGERKRIELASILVMRPKLVLMDEPDSGIDVEALNHIYKNLKFLKELGITVILITHSPNVFKHAEHGFLMCCGRLVDKGSVKRLTKYFDKECAVCEDLDPVKHGELNE
jgi:Fe-S cluster assembly ATP-binding protein